MVLPDDDPMRVSSVFRSGRLNSPSTGKEKIGKPLVVTKGHGSRPKVMEVANGVQEEFKLGPPLIHVSPGEQFPIEIRQEPAMKDDRSPESKYQREGAKAHHGRFSSTDAERHQKMAQKDPKLKKKRNFLRTLRAHASHSKASRRKHRHARGQKRLGKLKRNETFKRFKPSKPKGCKRKRQTKFESVKKKNTFRNGNKRFQ